MCHGVTKSRAAAASKTRRMTPATFVRSSLSNSVSRPTLIAASIDRPLTGTGYR